MKNNLSLEGKRVTVMGLGLHGGAVGTVKWLHQQKAKITVTDLKSATDMSSSLDRLKDYEGITYILGQHREVDFSDTDLVIQNPSVPRNSKYLNIARAAGVAIEMDSSIFFQVCPSKFVVGVTGTKGKTTTAHAIAALLKAVYPQTVAVGLDGISPLGALHHIQADTPVVFELSSWRLEALAAKHISPPVAVVTSLYPDHLNTYDSFEDYVNTKKSIVRYQSKNDRVLLNADDKLVSEWSKGISDRVWWYSLNYLAQGDGIYVDKEKITVRIHGSEVSLMSLNDIPLKYEHERLNVLPAILLAYNEGLNQEPLIQALSKLQRLPHRLEEVRTHRGVTYINDSAATMPEATMAALKALQDRPLVLIAGGNDKELTYDDFAQQLRHASIRAMVLLPGQATQKMRQSLLNHFRDVLPTVYDVASMQEAIIKAQQVAEPGDVVLLSPAATSFGLFLNEFDRGDQFRKHVNNL